MSQQAAMNIGKTKVSIDVRGCIDCGTKHSSGWHPSRIIVVVIRGREFPVTINRCADCSKRK